jgi:hypothetical protein
MIGWIKGMLFAKWEFLIWHTCLMAEQGLANRWRFLPVG